MASQRVGEASNLSGSGHHNTMSYAVFHGLNPPTTSFIRNQEVSGFHFGELEEAILLQGVKNITNDDAKTSLYASAAGARPAATLEMFPSWPTRLLQTTSGSTPKSGENSTSDSGINTISSSRGVQMDEFLEQESPMSKNTSSSADQYSLLLPAPADDHNNNKHFQMSQSAVVVHHHQPLDILANDNNVPISSDFPQTTTHQTSTAAKPTNDKKRGPGSTSSKVLDAKTLRRLAQNREAARKSRLRKKAYVQQLETSRIRLAHIEQDLQRARAQQGLLLGGGGVAVGNNSSGAAMFDMEYARWLDDDNRHMSELRNALHVQLPDGDLRMVVDGYVAHYDEIFRLKGAAAKADIFHLITGMWSTPAERCFLWMGGFRPSELIKMLIVQLDPLTEQQVVGIYSLQHSSQQAEEALSQGLEQLQHSLIETIANGTINSDGMHHMVIALGKLTNLEGFVRQADNLRQQTLHQLRRILTVRQAARCFLAIGEYYSRLRALSSLWASRPRETMLGDEGSSQTTSELQMMQSSQNQFSNF